MSYKINPEDVPKLFARCLIKHGTVEGIKQAIEDMTRAGNDATVSEEFICMSELGEGDMRAENIAKGYEMALRVAQDDAKEGWSKDKKPSDIKDSKFSDSTIYDINFLKISNILKLSAYWMVIIIIFHFAEDIMDIDEQLLSVGLKSLGWIWAVTLLSSVMLVYLKGRTSRCTQSHTR